MTTRIDLNCDLGESYGAWTMGNDAAVLQFVSSANIACGFHGGDPATDGGPGPGRAGCGAEHGKVIVGIRDGRLHPCPC